MKAKPPRPPRSSCHMEITANGFILWEGKTERTGSILYWYWLNRNGARRVWVDADAGGFWAEATEEEWNT